MGVLIVIHIIICVLLMAVILMQSSKGDGMGSAFGGMGGGDTGAFSGREAANFLQKSTIGLAVAFFVISITITYLSSSSARVSSDSVLQENLSNQPTEELPLNPIDDGNNTLPIDGN